MTKRIGDVALTQSERNKRFYEKHREAELNRNKQYYEIYYPKHRKRLRASRRNGRHGITQAWYDAKLLEQGNRCAICYEVFESTPHIDHDHTCCKPLKSCDNCRRDLLCTDCNLGLGRFKDNIESLERAVQYLMKHKDSQCKPSPLPA
jgi:hypothetical protein